MSSSAASLARSDTTADASTTATAGTAAEPRLESGPIRTERPEAKPASKVERLANVERLRVLAMLEIVRYHDHDDRLLWVGGLGLPTFLLLTNLFNTTLTEKRGLSKFLADKRERLFLPWVFWSLLYGGVLAVTALRHSQPLSEVLSWNMILAGTNSHLWFVPFALFSAGLVAGAQYLTRSLPDRPVAYSAAGVGLVVLLVIGLMPQYPFEAPIPQWLLSLPSSFFGFALGRFVLAWDGKVQVRDMVPIAIVCAIGAVAFGVFAPNMLIWRYSVSILIVFVAFLRPGTIDPISKFMSPLLFGIYLAHPFIGHRMLVKIPGLEHSQLFFIADFVITAIAVHLLKKTPLRRFV